MKTTNNYNVSTTVTVYLNYSLSGQLMDELAILWMFMAGLAILLPKRYFPAFFHGSR